MTTYTATFRTDTAWATEEIEADTPELALEKACAIGNTDPAALDWRLYDDIGLIDEIEITGADAEDVCWQSEYFRLRVAAADVLAALELAVAALNQAPRFRVPGFDMDSYQIASRCDAAIKEAKG